MNCRRGVRMQRAQLARSCGAPALLYLHALALLPQPLASSVVCGFAAPGATHPVDHCHARNGRLRRVSVVVRGAPASGVAFLRLRAAGGRETGCRMFMAAREARAGGEALPSFDQRAPEDLHVPVLAEEVAEVFRGVDGGIRRFIDGTLGMGGHSSAICSEHWDTLQLLMGIDQDPAALLMAGKRLHAARAEGRAVLVSGNFEDMGRLAAENGIEKESVDGILLDIGTSSLQLDEAERGFSFMRDGPLDMRMDPRQGLTAADIVNTWDETEIARVIYEYGEERKSRAIARKIVAARQVKPIETTLELCRVIGGPRHGKGIHPATLAFQGLRIAVNRELHVLEKALPQAVDLLRPGGRLAVISFHSLEDRIVKNWFLQVGQLPQRQKNKYAQFSKLESEEETNDEEGGGGGGGGRGAKDSDLVILTKRPIVAGECETHVNPRARSAKLRVLEKRPSS